MNVYPALEQSPCPGGVRWNACRQSGFVEGRRGGGGRWVGGRRRGRVLSVCVSDDERGREIGREEKIRLHAVINNKGGGQGKGTTLGSSRQPARSYGNLCSHGNMGTWEWPPG